MTWVPRSWISSRRSIIPPIISRTRETRRVLSSLCPFLTFLRVGQGYVDREKRESRLWLNSFWLNYSDFIVGFVVTLWYVVGFFFNFRWGIIDRSSSKDFRETLIHDRWSLFLLVIRKNLLKITGNISRRNLELLYPVKTILASTRNSIS